MVKLTRLALMGWLLIGGVTLTPVLPAQELSPLSVSRLMPELSLKVVRLTAIGPDGNRGVLVEAPEGVLVPIDDFSGLKTKLDAARLQPAVAYHSLQAELAPGVYTFDTSGNWVELALKTPLPTRIPLMGAVLKLDDGVRLLGVRPEAPPVQETRKRDCFEREHDD